MPANVPKYAPNGNILWEYPGGISWGNILGEYPGTKTPLRNAGRAAAAAANPMTA
jgi:hypothetical protein